MSLIHKTQKLIIYEMYIESYALRQWGSRPDGVHVKSIDSDVKAFHKVLFVCDEYVLSGIR